MTKIKFYNFASGSKGNASLIYTESTKILVDFGISKKRLNECLERLGMSIDDINYFLITHDHVDHIKHIERAPKERCFSVENVLENYTNSPLFFNKPMYFGDILVTTIRTSHDSKNSCGFLFENDGIKICYITDTGKLLKTTLKKLVDCDYYYFESNYDKFMLETSSRPYYLIERIKSDYGHLSNKKSAKYLGTLVTERTKVVALAHLSEECNTPSKAIETHESIWHSLEKNRHIKLITCSQYEVTEIC